jgi:hypothetical protein
LVYGHVPVTLTVVVRKTGIFLARWLSFLAGICAFLAFTAPPAVAAPSGTRITADFDGNGVADLAVGVPGENGASGAVHVLYGASSGLSATGSDFFTGTGGFGLSLAAADFDADGFADLAVGAPNADLTSSDGTVTVFGAGEVHVLYGSSSGLSTSGATRLFQSFDGKNAGIADGAEEMDRFGVALAAGQFGKAGPADLAIGVSHEDREATGDTDAGAVNVVYGAFGTGLVPTGSQFWHQDNMGGGESAESDDRIGLTLAAANFGKSTHADLAVGGAFEQSLRNQQGVVVADAGVVHVLYGSGTNGLVAPGQLWHQARTDIADNAESDDFFAQGLSAANFGKSAENDLVVGVFGEAVGAAADAGAVHVIYGTANGLSASGSQFWTQNTATGTTTAVKASDKFGFAVTGANFGKSAEADLAIGVPGQDIGTNGDAGAVNVLYGTANGLSNSGNQFWHQNNATGQAEADDAFGSALASWNFGKSSQADLAVGTPFEDLANNTIDDAGSVNVLYGTSTGLSSTGVQGWNQNSAGITDSPEASDQFGLALNDFGALFLP